MNERIKQECRKVIPDIHYIRSLASTEYPTFDDLCTLAEHFYNLALEDVKKEMIRKLEEIQENDDAGFPDTDNAYSTISSVLYFIDQLSK